MTERAPVTAFVALGGNLGDARAAVRQAIKGLAALGGGSYSMTLHIAGRTITESGSYVLEPAATTFFAM